MPQPWARSSGRALPARSCSSSRAPPRCGVDFYYIKFWTIGGAGETTESSGALMVPTGAARLLGPAPDRRVCARYERDKALNIADITNTSNTEGALIAAMFAAQGYIVVAPNYAGYDISTLGYHPFLNAVQQSGEMMDILAAARTRCRTRHGLRDERQRSIVPHRLLGGRSRRHGDAARDAGGRDQGNRRRADVRPLCPRSPRRHHILRRRQSGIDRVLPALGQQLSARVRQRRQHTLPLFSSTYPNVETLLPSDTPIDTIFEEGLLPETALFDSTTPVVAGSAELTALLGVPPTPALPASAQTPIFDLGFGNPYLINNDFRVAYAEDALADPDGAVPTPALGVPRAAVEPTFGLRQDFWLNDLRTAWAPESPTLLCGGDEDPTVFFSVDTETMAAYWSSHCPPASSRCSTSMRRRQVHSRSCRPRSRRAKRRCLPTTRQRPAAA
jgi:hypothetical protein